MDVHTSESAYARTYAQPLAGLRVSWGAILAGAVATLAVSLILWSLCLAITLTATNATFASLKGSFLALWICAIVTTLIGGLVGGAVAGYLPGNPRRLIAIGHGFLAWCVAFLIATAVEWGMFGRAVNQSAQAALSTANAALQTTGSAVGGVASGGSRLDQRAENLLLSLGYSPPQARQMVNSAQKDLQDTLRGRGGGPTAEPGAMKGEARGALDTIINWSAGLGWSWFGTWFITGLLAMLGGALVSRWLQRAQAEWEEAPVSAHAAPPPAAAP